LNNIWGGGSGGRGAQTMYTHMNKCINNKKVNVTYKVLRSQLSV
jgi:hypothetical protein